MSSPVPSNIVRVPFFSPSLPPVTGAIGGLTEMRRVAALASAHNMPISTHIFTEQSLCIGASCYNCISVEHIPWFAPLFLEALEVRDGDIVVPDRPGTDFTFSTDAVKRYQLKD